MLETLSFAENVGRNGRQDSLQSLDLQDSTAFCDFIRATQSCRQGVDRPPSLALRRLVWVDRAECMVASCCISSPCRLLCTWNGPNRAMALPPFVVTRVCTFCTFVCSFSHNFVSQAGSEALEQNSNALFQSLYCLWKPPLASPDHFCHSEGVSQFSG